MNLAISQKREQTAPNPVLTTLKYFKNEYVEHIIDKKCAAHECTNLLKYEINAELCRGCTLCSKKCPVNAISGTVKNPHTIDMDKCIKCGNCKSVCKFNAVEVK